MIRARARWSERSARRLVVALLVGLAFVSPARGQPPPASDAGMPADYTIGPEDVLGVLVWREPDLSVEVTVRPDGHITVPLVNDVLATGKTPADLREHLRQRLKDYVKDPNVTIIVREIKSRTVSITGRVPKPGAYPLLGPMRALDLIARAGGLLPSADARHLSVLRTDKGARVSLPIDYTKLSHGTYVWQDVLLKPGDTLVVP